MLLLLGQRDTEVNCLRGAKGDPEDGFYVPAVNKNTDYIIVCADEVDSVKQTRNNYKNLNEPK